MRESCKRGAELGSLRVVIDRSAESACADTAVNRPRAACRGTHAELIGRGGAYHALVQRQLTTTAADGLQQVVDEKEGCIRVEMGGGLIPPAAAVPAQAPILLL